MKDATISTVVRKVKNLFRETEEVELVAASKDFNPQAARKIGFKTVNQ